MNRKLTIHRKTKLKGRFRLSFRFIQFTQILLNIFISTECAAMIKTSVSSGNWNNSACWSPAGIPTKYDDVTVSANHAIILDNDGQVHTLTIAYGGKLSGTLNKTLKIAGNITVNGTVDMNGCNINLQNYGSIFILGQQAVFTWSPGNNSYNDASLFINGFESFDDASTLIIKRWFDYTMPLGEIISGSFGNLEINSPGGTNSIIEWNQKNKFESHPVKGTLTVDQGWITLDKSGSITSTTIGNIILKSINSTFIAHNGTHPSSFTLKTGSIRNNGGKFYGLNDGNGKITLQVSGNFYNAGNVKIINNSGVNNVSNGNATLRVDGDFIQSSGDTRIIYNVTTTNSGIFNATIRNLTLTGGIFMGQSACHTGGQINLLNILQDLTVNFSNATDIFRGSGISSIGSTVNNAGFALIVGRNMVVSGTDQAEFTSSASAGDEMVNVHGDLTFQGCTSSFNYGTMAASHASEFLVQGNLLINGGSCFLSRNKGKIRSVIDKDFKIASGLFVIKGNSGPATFTVNGAFIQRGGSTLIHSSTNLTTATISDTVQILVKGTFNHKGGTIDFDDNASGASNMISIMGDSCLLSGNGIITHAGAGSSAAFGHLNFNKAGKIYYSRNGNAHLIEQVVQTVNDQCELLVIDGDINLASHNSGSFYEFKIMKGGRLTLDNSSISSNGLHTNCKVFVDSSAVISLTNKSGLYGYSESVFKPEVNFFLHPESIVEYCNSKPQYVTGLKSPSDQNENKYGILRIMLNNTDDPSFLDDNVNIRTRLELIGGSLNLNDHTLTIENGNADAIRRIGGFIISDLDSLSQNIICWKSMKSGLHEFPFGRSPDIYLPVKYNLLTGAGNDVSVSTRRTEKDNLPYPGNTGKLSSDGKYAETKAVDRWWTISAPGVKANITFTYSGDENTLLPELATRTLFAFQWSGVNWTKLPFSCSGNVKNTGTITLNNISRWSHFLIASDAGPQTLSLVSFDAVKNENDVLIKWETINEADSATFVIEKSDDGINFHEIESLQKNTSTDNLSKYNFSDIELPQDVSFYRIRYIVNNDSPLYSETKRVSATNINKSASPVKINSVSPNPFTSDIKIQYSAYNENATLEIVDSQGRLVLNQPVKTNEAEQGSTILNLDYLKKGIYFLNIISNGKKDTMKIIKNE